MSRKLPPGVQNADLIGLHPDDLPTVHHKFLTWSAPERRKALAVANRPSQQARLPTTTPQVVMEAIGNAPPACAVRASHKDDPNWFLPVGPPTIPRQPRPANAPSEANMSRAFGIVRNIRNGGHRKLKDPKDLLFAISTLSKVTNDMMENRFPERPVMPGARAEYMKRACNGRRKLHFLKLWDEECIWQEFCAWANSAGEYASAFKVWIHICAARKHNLAVPTPSCVSSFGTMFHNADTLKQYFSHVRSVLHWCHLPLEALEPELCRKIGAGCAKQMVGSVRRENTRHPVHKHGL